MGAGEAFFFIADDPGEQDFVAAARERRDRVCRSPRMQIMVSLQADLPGHEIVSEGIEDLVAGRESESALLVAMAAPRLRRLGLHVPEGGGARPSHRLYELLADTGEGPHSRYNALVARVVSFARAAEHASAG